MIKLIVSTFLFFIMQITIVNNIAIFHITPDIVLIVILYIALFYGEIGMWIGFGIGIFLDLYNFSLGCNALMLSLIGYGAKELSGRIYRDAPLLWGILIITSSVIKNIIIFIMQKELSFQLIITYILPEAIYTTVVGIILFYIFKNYLFMRNTYNR
ncbi:MAG: rod shape-determining protein MreD [bacterium]|nr:rod shape-determining protein MreD [bacterium]